MNGKVLAYVARALIGVLSLSLTMAGTASSGETETLPVTHIGTSFWATQMGSTAVGFGVGISNPSTTTAATVTVTNVAGPVTTVTVAPGDFLRLDLGDRFPVTSCAQSETSDSRTYSFTSDIPIAMFQADAMANEAANDASLLIPEASLGTEYTIATWSQAFNSGCQQIAIIATSVGRTDYEVRDAAGAIVETGSLDQYQTREFLRDDSSDLTGWRVVTDQPAAVFAGNTCTSIGDGCCCDHIEEQMPAESALGTSYALSPFRYFPTGAVDRSKDVFRIVATEDGTTVETTPDVGRGTLARGEFLEIITNEDFLLCAGAPVLVAQFMISQGTANIGAVATAMPNDGDPSLLIATPLGQETTDATFGTLDGYRSTFLDIITVVGTTAELDGTPVLGSCDPIGSFGGPDYCRIREAIADGAHRLTADGPFTARLVGTTLQGSYGFAIGAGFDAAPFGPCDRAAIDVDLDVKPGSCPNPINFRSRGVIPVAVTTNDATTGSVIDPSSVDLEGVSALRCVLDDVSAPNDEAGGSCCATPGPDGFPDLVCHFDKQAVAAAICSRRVPPPGAGDTITVVVDGLTFDGDSFSVSDCIRVQTFDCSNRGRFQAVQPAQAIHN